VFLGGNVAPERENFDADALLNYLLVQMGRTRRQFGKYKNKKFLKIFTNIF
jgi:hypothetical protein